MTDLAIDGIESTWLDATDRAALRAEFEATVDALLADGETR